MQLSIRLAKNEDCHTMLDIYSYYVRETAISWEYEPPTLTDFERRFDTFAAQFPWLVCEANGRVVGYSYAHRFRERTAYDWTAECTVYVRNGLQRNGIGRMLYRCLLDTLRLQGYRTAIGGVSLPNAYSEALHAAFGFTMQGEIGGAGYKAGAWHNLALYVLSLSDYPVEPASPVSINQVKGTKAFAEILEKAMER